MYSWRFNVFIHCIFCSIFCQNTLNLLLRVQYTVYQIQCIFYALLSTPQKNKENPKWIENLVIPMLRLQWNNNNRTRLQRDGKNQGVDCCRYLNWSYSSIFFKNDAICNNHHGILWGNIFIVCTSVAMSSSSSSRLYKERQWRNRGAIRQVVSIAMKASQQSCKNKNN